MAAATKTGPRLTIGDADPDAYRAVLALEKYVHAGGIDPALLELVKIRASQLNSCAWCLDMHLTDARKAGIDQRKLDVITAWHEAGDLFSETEQAVLAFTEEVTLIGESGVSDETWAATRRIFDEKDMVVLLMAVCAINVWNRLNVTLRTPLPERATAE